SSAGIRLHDLGSTAGTFIDGELVEQASVKPGQLIRLGEVSLRLESDEPASAEAPPLAPRLPPPKSVSPRVSSNFCKFHPRTGARFACPRCQVSFCELCVSVRRVGVETKRLCRTCGSECETITAQLTAPKPALGFARSLPGALIYPFQGSGIMMLVAGTIFFFLLSWVPLLGLIVTGYMFSYAKAIITSTADGRDDLPDWPDFGDWKDDILMPYLQLLALLALFFGPALIVAVWHPGTDTQSALGLLAALAFGAFLAPMGMLALAMFDTFAALNPVALMWSILRIPGPYFAAATSFLLALMLYWFVAGALEKLVGIPLFAGLISAFLYLYLLAVGVRILGLLYRTRREDLAWFKPAARRSA
ncbi:MAG TPA: FHA domain-containing protein, partial [Verrucomicrobiae bacterium]|nr:FHA domain-containing protein [Verrucomicrobiae bacterium]